MKKSRFRRIVYILCVTAICFIPYCLKGIWMGSDAPFHLARIESLNQALQMGIFPVKVHPSLAYSYGYGVGIFYPDFFIYLPAVLRMAGCSLEVSYKIYIFILLLELFVSMYVCVRKKTGDIHLALAAGTLYLFSYPVIDGIFKSFTLAQTQALVFLPLALMGMVLFVEKDEFPWMLGIGFAGLIYSHALSTAIALVLCFVLLVFQLPKWIGKKKKWLYLLTAVAGVSGITVSYWGPMLEQMKAQSYKVSQPWTHVSENVLALHSAFGKSGVGIVILLLSCLAICAFVWNRPCKSWSGAGYFIGGIFLILLTTNQGFWKTFEKAFDILQFPGRLMGAASVLLIFAFAVIFAKDQSYAKWKNLSLGCILALSMLGGLFYWKSNEMPVRENWDNRNICEEIAGIGAGEEWLPAVTTRENLQQPGIVVSNSGKSYIGEFQGRELVVRLKKEDAPYQLPLVWYKGYHAETEDGLAGEINRRGSDGLVELTDISEKDAVVRIWYLGTPFQKICYIINVCAAGIMLFIALAARHRRRAMAQ